MSGKHLRTNYYIDGFNLYYGCIKDTPWKWLNLEALCQKAYPALQMNRIRYFTAKVKSLPDDPDAPKRQEIFIRAVKTLPDLSVHFGFFSIHRMRQRLVNPPPKGGQTAYVFDPEEKGSDVNLASYLLFDGFQGEYDVAIVVSNDSDLCEPIKLARQELGLTVGVLVPAVKKGRHPSSELRRVSDPQYYRMIRQGALKSCQFPEVLHDSKGAFSKPETW